MQAGTSWFRASMPVLKESMCTASWTSVKRLTRSALAPRSSSLVAEVEDDQAVGFGVIMAADGRAWIVAREGAVRRVVFERDDGHAVRRQAQLEAAVAEMGEEVLGQRFANRQRRLAIVRIRITEPEEVRVGFPRTVASPALLPKGLYLCDFFCLFGVSVRLARTQADARRQDADPASPGKSPRDPVAARETAVPCSRSRESNLRPMVAA